MITADFKLESVKVFLTGVLLTGPKIHAKIPCHSGECVLGESQLYALPPMADVNMILDTRVHIWFIKTVYYKMRQTLLQNATDIFLQNATEVY